MSNASVVKALYRACLRFSSAVDGVPFELLSRDAKLLCPHSPLAAVVATQGSQQIRWLAEHEFRQSADHTARMPPLSCSCTQAWLRYSRAQTAARSQLIPGSLLCHLCAMPQTQASNTTVACRERRQMRHWTGVLQHYRCCPYALCTITAAAVVGLL